MAARTPQGLSVGGDIDGMAARGVDVALDLTRGAIHFHDPAFGDVPRLSPDPEVPLGAERKGERFAEVGPISEMMSVDVEALDATVLASATLRTPSAAAIPCGKLNCPGSVP
jgi:hypothetical protein